MGNGEAFVEASMEALVEVASMEALVEAFVKVTSMGAFVEASVEVRKDSVDASVEDTKASVECFPWFRESYFQESFRGRFRGS